MSHELEDIIARASKHEAAGYLRSHAFKLAVFEARVDMRWPPDWGTDFEALVFGDFDPPDAPLTYSELGITVYPEKQTGTVINTGMSVLRARVSISEKSVKAVKDAVRRLNLLVGILGYTNMGAPIRWWSYITSASAGGHTYTLTDKDPATLLGMINLLPIGVRHRVEAALYWAREPRSMLSEQQARPDQLAVYAGYWNAFECLVEGVNTILPIRRLTRTEKNDEINQRVASANGVFDVSMINDLYHEIVHRGLREKASHAIRQCIGDQATEFIAEAFDYAPHEHGLYAIRNSINHGTVDIHDPETVMLVDSRFSSLYMLVRLMFNGLLRLNATNMLQARAPKGA